MSADLFAEFSTDSSENQGPQSKLSIGLQPASTVSFFHDLNSQAPAASSQHAFTFAESFGHTSNLSAQSATEGDADDWGDFEGGSGQVDLMPSAQHDPFTSGSNHQPQPPQHISLRQPPVRDPFAFQSIGASQTSQEPWTKAPIVKAKKPLDSNVLFDAEDGFDDDDDFGDFEDSQSHPVAQAPTAQPAPSTLPGTSSALVDLLGDLDLTQSSATATSKPSHDPTSIKTKARPTARKSPVGGFGTAAKAKQIEPKSDSKPVSAITPHSTDDGWDTFDDWEASIPAKTTKSPAVDKGISTAKTSVPAPILFPAINDIPSGEQPPTNVPPPGVLLSLFPSFFADAQEHLFKPMAAQTLPMRNKLLAEPGTITYLRGYVMLASVAAHIIAGRKLRWKRDQLLSQGMRIGPASSRATSGMKLAGIDRGENLKEEREVSDVVRVWKDQIGRLRHVISGVNQIKAGTLSPAPDLQETMPVRTLKQSEGGVPARRPCMLCGLKRDERVTSADMAIEDSFGEWWIEQVNMHRGCRNFWNEHKDMLRQR